MRTQEVINKVNEAQKEAIQMTFRKDVSFSDNNTIMDYMSKGDAWEYLKGVKSAYIKIEHSNRVVNSTVKKLKSLGFSISLVETTEEDFGLVRHYITVSK